MLRALLIRRPWIDRILDGSKTLEIRGAATKLRGKIALIASGSGTVVGVCDLAGCLGPFSQAEFRRNAAAAGMLPAEAKLGHYRQTYGWELRNPIRLERPVAYRHPSGAIIWVQLEPAVEAEVMSQVGARSLHAVA